MKRSFWFRRIAGGILIATVIILLFGYIVMGLWNSVLATVVNVRTITFAQALGILVLSKILFGGFRGGWGGRGGRWRARMDEKWQAMSPDEREKFKQQMRNRCGKWGGYNAKEQRAEAGV